MAHLKFVGTRDELVAYLQDLVESMTGSMSDSTGAASDLKKVMGLSFLESVKRAYETKSEGGTDEMGTTWKPLSPVTLALRSRVTKGSAAAKQAALITAFRGLPKRRQDLIAVHYTRLLEFYSADVKSGTPSASAKVFARRLLELMQPFIPKGRYQKIHRELHNTHPTEKVKQLAQFGAYALILRDTGRLLNSLDPRMYPSTDMEMDTAQPGLLTVGSRVTTRSGLNLLMLHDSDKPRKKKKDGSDRLPRRQVLPDKAKPVPTKWWDDMNTALVTAMQQRALWSKVLRGRIA